MPVVLPAPVQSRDREAISRRRASEEREGIIVAALVIAAIAIPHPFPAHWKRDALCIHRYESTDWHRTTDWRGNPSTNHGGMQFDMGRWLGVVIRFHLRYPHDPADATPTQQLSVAWIVTEIQDGGSWREWTTHPKCGL
jgi:hypothetical protein